MLKEGASAPSFFVRITDGSAGGIMCSYVIRSLETRAMGSLASISRVDVQPGLQLRAFRSELVYRVGAVVDSITPQARGRDSHEAHLLSVSHCPDAWSAIARLGGEPVCSLAMKGALWLDGIQFQTNTALRRLIVNWGHGAGLCYQATGWRAWFEQESGDWGCFLCKTRDEAAGEVEGWGGDPDGQHPSGHPAVQRVSYVRGTDALSALTGNRVGDGIDSYSDLAIVWAEHISKGASNIVGIWWNERYDVCELSAPRGGVFPRFVSAMEREALAGMPDDFEDTELVEVTIGVAA